MRVVVVLALCMVARARQELRYGGSVIDRPQNVFQPLPTNFQPASTSFQPLPFVQQPQQPLSRQKVFVHARPDILVPQQTPRPQQKTIVFEPESEVAGLSPPIIVSSPQAFFPPELDCGPEGGLVDQTLGSEAFHFSWCHDGGRVYTFQEAQRYCSRLGHSFRPVSLENEVKDDFIVDVIAAHDLDFVWTGGNRLYSPQWSWGPGVSSRGYTNWATTGGLGLPQPDDREGDERCLAVLSGFFGDPSVAWHDIACHHAKPTVCQTNLYQVFT